MCRERESDCYVSLLLSSYTCCQNGKGGTPHEVFTRPARDYSKYIDSSLLEAIDFTTRTVIVFI